MITRTFNFGRSIAVLGALLAMFILATAAMADSVTGTATVQGGTFSYSAVDNPAFGTSTLDGTNQTLTDPIDITVSDLTGTGNGWYLDIAAEQFTDASANTLPADALTITAVSASATSESAVAPTNSVGYPLTVGTTAASFFNAAADTGMGAFTVTPTLELSVPATTYAGTYTSNVTITAQQSP